MTIHSLTHRERMETTLAGGKPDRTPVALWRHFPVDDQRSDTLAAATAAFQRQFDFDLIKVTPASSYCVRDWGAEDRWSGNSEGTRDYTKIVIQQPEDWSSLKALDPRQGRLGAQIECLERLVKEFSPRTPIIQTIFSPLSQAKNLVGRTNLAVHLRRDPQALHAALRTITQTTLDFIEACASTGIDGIFYAVQHAQYGVLSVDEYREFGRPYDLSILEAARGLWLNLLHLHGSDVMFGEVKDFPVQMVNWHDRETPPTLAEARGQFPGTLVGGLRQWDTMVLGTPEQVRAEALDALRTTGGQRFMLGTGCVVPVTAPFGNIMAARRAVETA